MEQETQSLLDFSWDENVEAIMGNEVQPSEEGVLEQFQEIKLSVEEEDEKTQQKEEAPKKDAQPKQVELKVEKEPDFTPQEEGNNSIYYDVYKDLKDYGILKNVELNEDIKDLTADQLAQLYDEDYNLEVQKRLEEFANEDPELKDLIRFRMAGGSVRDFVSHAQTEPVVPEGDINDEEFQDNIIRYQLAREGWDADEIEDRLEHLTKNGKKESTAKKYASRLQEERDLERERLLEEQERRKFNQIQQENNFKNEVSAILQQNNEINGYKIANKEKQGIYDFITRRNIKVNENQAVTGFQKKLAETLQDNKKVVLLAKMLMNDFNFKDFEKQVETQVTKKVKSNLENRKGLKSTSFGSSTKSLNLSDIFGN